jgi:hypothetical protein
MAETAPAAALAAESASNTRPTRPDENAFKEQLAKAEKEHKASMDKLVRLQSRY